MEPAPIAAVPGQPRCARRAAGLLAALAAAGLLAVGPSAAAPASRSCPTPRYPSLGYFDRITVTGVGCATGNRLALAYYRCRTRAGDKAGRCPGGVLGFRCHEVRNASSTEILARVTCRRARATVVHVYTQDLSG